MLKVYRHFPGESRSPHYNMETVKKKPSYREYAFTVFHQT